MRWRLRPRREPGQGVGEQDSGQAGKVRYSRGIKPDGPGLSPRERGERRGGWGELPPETPADRGRATAPLAAPSVPGPRPRDTHAVPSVTHVPPRGTLGEARKSRAPCRVSQALRRVSHALRRVPQRATRARDRSWAASPRHAAHGACDCAGPRRQRASESAPRSEAADERQRAVVGPKYRLDPHRRGLWRRRRRARRRGPIVGEDQRRAADDQHAAEDVRDVLPR